MVLGTTQPDLTELTKLSGEEVGLTVTVRYVTFTVASFFGKLLSSHLSILMQSISFYGISWISLQTSSPGNRDDNWFIWSCHCLLCFSVRQKFSTADSYQCRVCHKW